MMGRREKYEEVRLVLISLVLAGIAPGGQTQLALKPTHQGPGNRQE